MGEKRFVFVNYTTPVSIGEERLHMHAHTKLSAVADLSWAGVPHREAFRKISVYICNHLSFKIRKFY